MKSVVLGRPFHVRFAGRTDFQYVADTAAAFIASADVMPEGAHVFNLHGETVGVDRIVQVINENARSSNGELVTYGGPPIPVAPALNDAAIRKTIGDLPSTPLEVGIRTTIDQFALLHDQGRLDTSDIDA